MLDRPDILRSLSYLNAWAREDSINAELAPMNAMIHIQNTAPGPPKKMAVATPAIFPILTRDPTVAAKA